MPLIVETWRKHEADSLFNATKLARVALDKPEDSKKMKTGKRRKKNKIVDLKSLEVSTNCSILSNDHNIGVSQTINLAIPSPCIKRIMATNTLMEVMERVKIHERELYQLKLETTSSRLSLCLNTLLDKRLLKKKRKDDDTHKDNSAEETAVAVNLLPIIGREIQNLSNLGANVKLVMSGDGSWLRGLDMTGVTQANVCEIIKGNLQSVGVRVKEKENGNIWILRSQRGGQTGRRKNKKKEEIPALCVTAESVKKTVV